MRVDVPGVFRITDPVSFEFEGQAVQAHLGETVAAALIATGCWATRETRFGEQRGLFCGMGVCGECIVLVNGVTRRACLEPVSAGLKVSRHPVQTPCVQKSAETTPGASRFETLKPDVLVVGAGPAGLAAACAASEAGLEAVVVDERKTPGGQYFKQPGSGFAVHAERLDRQFREGRALARATKDSGARLVAEATVWGAFDSSHIVVSTPDGVLMIRPRRLVLATGAYERAVPFPGWTLPGVMTTGAAQTLLRGSQVSPGKRVVVAGNGPLNLQVARELTVAGAEVVALVEVATTPGPASVGSILRMAATSPRLVLDGLAHTLTLRGRRVPMFHQHALVRVTGARRAETAIIACIDENGRPVAGTEKSFACDAVCVGYGFLPQSELARSLGCRHTYDALRGGLMVERDTNGRTSIPEVFVVGDAGGLGGARIALAQGTLAGITIARDLGYEITPGSQASEKRAARALNRHRRFQQALWRLYRAPLLTDQLATPCTYICRCEGVTKGSIETLGQDADSLGALKRISRAGMGRCQGRYCSPVIAEMMRCRTGAELAESDFFAPRPPARPVQIGSIAALASTKRETDEA